jgi:hypothetical protein
MKHGKNVLLASVLCLVMAAGLLPSMTRKAHALETDGTNYTVSTEEDLQEAFTAINAAEAGEYSITLAEDIVVSNNLDLEKNTVTLYGENHTLHMMTAHIIVKNGGRLNLGAENYEKKLIIADKAPASGNACTPLVTINKSALFMYEGVTLSGRNGVDTTGGVQLEQSEFTMYGGKIIDCKTDTAAGGVLAYNKSEFVMLGGAIEGCSNSHYGGGVMVRDNSAFELSGGTISDCSSLGSGGGVYVLQSEFKMSKGQILGCSSVNYGGGVYLTGNSKFQMTGGTIKACTNSYVGGGGVCVGAPGRYSDNTFEMIRGEITECEATSNRGGLGGGVLVMNGLAQISSDSKIYNNHSVTAGDDVFAYGPTSGRNPTDTGLRISDVPEGLILSETNGAIDGWYADGVVDGEDTERWDVTTFYQKYTPSPEAEITSQMALKAAHGPIVEPIPVTLTAESLTTTYDGTEKTVEGFTCSVEGVNFDNLTASAKGTKAGEYAVEFSRDPINDEAVNDTGVYVVSEVVEGKLIIKKRALTVTAKSSTKAYDGTPLTVDDAECDNLASGDYLAEITVTGSQTDAGSTESIPGEAVIKNAAGEDVTNCYEITYANGTLTVEKAPAPKELSQEEKPAVSAENLMENGTEQELIIAPKKLPEGYRAIEYSKDGGETWSTDIPTGKEVGEYPIQVRYIADGNHTDFEGELLTAVIKEKPKSDTTDGGEAALDPAAPTGDAMPAVFAMAICAAMAFVYVIRRKKCEAGEKGN